jgi:hypothetical protein
MKLPKISIAKLMVIVGIVALNFAAVRVFIEEGNGFFLIGIALQIGILCLIRCRIEVRPFWWGFEAFGLVAGLTLFLIGLVGEDDSELLRLMNWYFISIFNIFENILVLIKDPQTRGRLTVFVMEDSQKIILEIAYFLPQLLIAVVGGFLTSLIVRRWGMHRQLTGPSTSEAVVDA